MHRASRVTLTVGLATVFFGGRYALGQGEPRKTDVGSVYSMVAENSFASLPPIIPVAGADVEELTGKARVCLSMLNTFLRRIKKRPINSAIASTTLRNSSQICPRNKSKEIESEVRS
jgi:hypothetical protein